MRKLPRWALLWVVGLIFAGGVYLRGQTFTEPWTGGHNAWGGAMYGNIARNLVRYGYLQTGMGPVSNTGTVSPDQFEFYYHYPPLLVWLISLSFHVFGIHEWSARLVPLLFSLFSMALVYRFARDAFGVKTAVCALLFMAVLPIECYYGTHVDVYGSVAVFFSLLAVEGYRRWLASGPGAYCLCLTGVVLGCLTAWYTYFVIPAILAHFYFGLRRPPDPSSRNRMWLLPIAAVAIFSLFLVHRHFLLADGRKEVFESLMQKLLERTGYTGSEDSLGSLRYLYIHLRSILSLYTVPLAAMTGLWALLFLQSFWRNRLRMEDWCMAILLVYGFLHALVFPGFTPGHDYMVAAYSPGVALTAAAFVTKLAEAIKRPIARTMVIGILVAGTCAVATLRTQRLYSSYQRDQSYTLRTWGEIVSGLSGPTDPVFLPMPGDAILQYYMDRPATFSLDTPGKLLAAVAGTRGSYLIVFPESAGKSFPDLLAYLEKQYPKRIEKGLMIFLGRGT